MLASDRRNSENAMVFVLIHKMDLVPEDKRSEVFADHDSSRATQTA